MIATLIETVFSRALARACTPASQGCAGLPDWPMTRQIHTVESFTDDAKIDMQGADEKIKSDCVDMRQDRAT
jgi:hypothetical protein